MTTRQAAKLIQSGQTVTLRTFFNEVFEGKIVDQNRHDLMIEHVWQGNLQIGIFDRFDVQIVPADSNLA